MPASWPGRFARRIKPFLAAVEDIADAEGYPLNHRKTRIMRRGGYDQLRATLHNCARNGPQAESRSSHPDFRAHLEGRVVWLENVNPVRGERLRRIFEEIRW